MKKKNIVNLIKYYSQKNDASFINEAYEIAKDFEKNGDYNLAEYIVGLLSPNQSLSPQSYNFNSEYLKELNIRHEALFLPDVISSDIIGILNAVERNIGIHKFLFSGHPGTGKTEAVKQISNLLKRKLFIVETSALIDSRLGQTSKNIANLFTEINKCPFPNQIIILFDEIDSISMNRTDSQDLREMGRATTTMLNCLDNLNQNILLLATTNLLEHFDKALLRRFDTIINFDKYSTEDLLDIAEKILNVYLSKDGNEKKDIRLFRKIISLQDTIPFPGDLKNLIRTSIAFSDPENPSDYLKRLYKEITGDSPIDIYKLYNQNFTLREMEILTGISKSTISRELKEKKL